MNIFYQESEYYKELPRWTKIYLHNKKTEYKKNFIKSMIFQKEIPSLEKIWIETVNYCNLKCPFCPVGLGMRKEKLHVIDDSIYNHILNILETIDKSKEITISLYGHGEPLLDDKIFERSKTIKKILPNSRILLSTNSTFISERINELLDSSVDFIICNFYRKCDYEKTIDCFEKNNIEYFYYKGTFGKQNGKINIFYRKRYNEEDLEPKYEDWYTNRVGKVDIGEKPKNIPCVLPFFQLPFGIDGSVRYCCFDSLGDTSFDNVLNYSDIYTLWNSDKYNEIRNKIKESRFNLYNCTKCNTNDILVLDNMFR